MSISNPGVWIISLDPADPHAYDDVSILYYWYDMPEQSAVRLDVHKHDDKTDSWQPFHSDIKFNVPVFGIDTWTTFTIGGPGNYLIRLWSSPPGALDDVRTITVLT